MTSNVLNVSGGDSENLFEMKLDNVKNLSHILKVVSFNKEVSTIVVCVWIGKETRNLEADPKYLIQFSFILPLRQHSKHSE